MPVLRRTHGRQLEAPDLLGRPGVGRTPKERGEAPDMTNVVLLRMRFQASYQYVLLHALAKRRDRSIGRQGSHGKFLSLKGTPWSDRTLYLPRAENNHAYLTARTLPRSGFVHEAQSEVRLAEEVRRLRARRERKLVFHTELTRLPRRGLIWPVARVVMVMKSSKSRLLIVSLRKYRRFGRRSKTSTVKFQLICVDF